MSPVTRLRRDTISWILIVVAFVAIGFGYYRLDNESHARAEGERCTLSASLQPLRQIILFTTEPASLEGLTPERLEVVKAVNAQRAKARAELLPLIPKVNDANCSPSDSGTDDG